MSRCLPRHLVRPVSSRLRTLVVLTGLGLTLAGCATVADQTPSGSLYGNYLAARYATSQHQTDRAAAYYHDALRLDPTSDVLLERAFLMSVAAGEVDKALAISEPLLKGDPSNRLARLVLALRDVKTESYASAKDELKAAAPGPFAELVGTLTRAWASAGQGNENEAIAALDTFKGRAAFDLFRVYHQALILDMLGDEKGAKASYQDAMSQTGSTSIRIVLAYASFLDRTGHTADAREVIEQYQALSPDNPLTDHAREVLGAGGTLPPLVSTPAEGVAEALYGLSSALVRDQGVDLAELYINLGLYLRPDFDLAQILLAEIYEQDKRWDMAIKLYRSVNRESPLYPDAQIQAALALDRLDRQDEALTLLRQLEAQNPKLIDAIIAQADILRGHEKFTEATGLYTKAIGLMGDTPAQRFWTLYYARGICYERTDKWALAEKDLTLALELSDENPMVLNYLGYSWIEQHKNLDQALAMLQKAVEARPDDGFVIDSLGWAYFKLGRYDQAVEYLERAVELEPNDPTVNEHLGDALWKTGDKLNARFQWAHALEMKPEADKMKQLENKLVFGLDFPASPAVGEARPGVPGS